MCHVISQDYTSSPYIYKYEIYIYMHSCMLNMRLRHITLLANDILLWNNLTTVHSVYNYANMYTCITAIDSICNLPYIRHQ